MDQFRKRLAQTEAGGFVVSADELSLRVVLTCGDERDVVPARDETFDQPVAQPFDATVRAWWDLEPWWTDYNDP